MNRRWMSWSAVFTLVALAGAGSSLAASRATRTQLLRRAPHYIGKAPASIGGIAHMPLRLGSGISEGVVGRQFRATIEARVADVNAFLDTLGATQSVGPIGALSWKDEPILYVGAPGGFYAPVEGPDETELEGHGRDALLVHMSDPPAKWHAPVTARALELGADHLLYLWIDLSDYPIAQKNWKGSKVIGLGTGHRMAVPWLTSLDQPAEVLQFKGALYRADGRFVRAGAEAFHAQRTRFGHSVLGLQRAIAASDVDAVFTETRADLPDTPLAWQVALRNLVAQLAGRKDALIAAESD